MFTIPEQFSAVTKANFESQVAILTALTNQAFDGVAKIIDLNMNVAKTSLEESTAAAKQLLTAKDPQEFFSLSAAQAQPNAEKVLAYGRHLAAIASTTQVEFTKVAEAQIAETNRKIIALVDEASKNAPAGSENAIAFVKSAIGNANASYEQLTKTTKQAVETLEANMNTAASQFSQAAAKTGAKAAAAAKK
jgi:phasin family protein